MARSFRRVPAWTARQAAARIEAKLSAVASEIAKSEAEQIRIAADLIDLKAFRTLLGDLLQVEQRKIESRNERQPAFDGFSLEASTSERTRSSEPLSVEHPATSNPDVLLRSASAIDGRRSYDPNRKLFLGSPEIEAVSVEPRRVNLLPEHQGDWDMERLVRMIEVPGLLHTMVMAERAQVVILPKDVVVPDEAVGLSLAEAFVGHEFSTQALNLLKDPDKASAFLEIVRDVRPKPGSDE